MNILLLILFSPILLIYRILCFTIPLIRIGKIQKSTGITAYIAKDIIHSDFLFPSKYWQEYPTEKEYIKIGWGDRKIFLETQTWNDLKTINLIKAFLGLNKTCLRIQFLETIPNNSTKIEMNQNQLKILKEYVKNSNNQKPITKKSTDYQNGYYYESNLNYNPINNCNNWINKGLRKAKLSNRIWTPLSFWL